MAKANQSDRGSEPIRAAGVVVFHPQMNPDRHFLAVHRPSRHDWSLPKGKVDAGEMVPCAAVRECDEETGYRVSLSTRLPTLNYQAGGQDKTVDYWIGEVRGDEGFAPDEEVDEIRWVPVAQAEEFLTYPDDAALVRQAVSVPNTTPLIILRHAKAMKRSDYEGSDDAERPLSGRGRGEAKRLADALDAYGIEQVHSSPFKRCVSTVNRYAKAIGVDVQLEPSLSETGHANDPNSTQRRITELLHVQAPTVICTHRPVLPSVLSALAAGVGLEPADIHDEPLWDARLAPGAMLILHREWTPHGPRAYAVEQHAFPRS